MGIQIILVYIFGIFEIFCLFLHNFLCYVLFWGVPLLFYCYTKTFLITFWNCHDLPFLVLVAPAPVQVGFKGKVSTRIAPKNQIPHRIIRRNKSPRGNLAMLHLRRIFINFAEISAQFDNQITANSYSSHPDFQFNTL